MASRIEDYALIGNGEGAALVDRDGSIDWLSMPRFDSPACFAALLGGAGNGLWQIAPAAREIRTTRSYRGNSMILETTFETPEGSARLTDFMTRRDGVSDLVRIVRGLRGSLAMKMTLVVRFDYGRVVPWVSRLEDGRLRFVAGPDRIILDTAEDLRGEGLQTVSDFTVQAGEERTFALNWSPSFQPCPPPLQVRAALDQLHADWSSWSNAMASDVSEAVARSLLTLKALAHWQTGGIVAAATTSLPEKIGGTRNWDYRYCWLRDATFTLYALLGAGFVDEARAWREWLVRAVAGSPADLRIMYGVAGERRLQEYELPVLPGYEGSAPVRVGNAASGQLQLDVYGEVLDALYVARRAGLPALEASWTLECALVEHLESIWQQPDDGIWEVRGPRRHFTHSKVMAWVAFDRAIRSSREFGLEAPIDHWCTIRDAIHVEVCEKGFDASRGCFVQYYGASVLDASLLLIPVVGFLPADDSRVVGTLSAIEGALMKDGLLMRYDSGRSSDGLPPGEAAFLACSFWLVDNYILQGRREDAIALFDRLLSFRNDVGLLAEEYDTVTGRQLGNFPQAFSHLALINSAHSLASDAGPAHQRSAGSAATTKG